MTGNSDFTDRPTKLSPSLISQFSHWVTSKSTERSVFLFPSRDPEQLENRGISLFFLSILVKKKTDHPTVLHKTLNSIICAWGERRQLSVTLPRGLRDCGRDKSSPLCQRAALWENEGETTSLSLLRETPRRSPFLLSKRINHCHLAWTASTVHPLPAVRLLAGGSKFSPCL